MKCHRPWFEFTLRFNGKAGFCLFYRGQTVPVDLSKPLDLAQIWNQPALQEARKAIGEGDCDHAGCANCSYLKYQLTTPPYAHREMIPPFLSDRQKENWLKAIASYEAGEVRLDSFPVRYIFEFGTLCNIDCIMCIQREERTRNKDLIGAERLIEMKDYLSLADGFVIQGGEPFALPNVKAFLEFLAGDPCFSNTHLAFVTNGTLLGSFMDRLRPFRRVQLSVSLDAIGADYEAIRRKASWASTERNLLQFKETIAKDKPEWGINVSSVIMKSSLRHLSSYVAWCCANDIETIFYPMIARDFSQDEDIFNHP